MAYEGIKALQDAASLFTDSQLPSILGLMTNNIDPNQLYIQTSLKKSIPTQKPITSASTPTKKGGISNMSGGLQSGLGAASSLIGGIGAASNSQLNPEVLTARESVRSGISQLGPIGAIIGAATSVVDLIGDTTGLGLDSLDRTSAKRAGIGAGATANNILAAAPGVGLFAGLAAGKTKQGYISDQTNQLRGAYGGTTQDIDASVELGGKRTLFGKRKANRFINKQNSNNNLLTQIGEQNELRKSSNYGADLASQNYNRYLGNSGTNLVIGEKGMKFPELNAARKILEKLRAKAKTEIDDITMFADGGKMNVIAEGALHSRKNKLDDVSQTFEDLTKKGIPVVLKAEGGKLVQTAEIEGGELVLTKELTEKLEALFEDGSEEAMIEAGKLLAEELITNTDDKTDKILENDIKN